MYSLRSKNKLIEDEEYTKKMKCHTKFNKKKTFQKNEGSESIKNKQPSKLVAKSSEDIEGDSSCSELSIRLSPLPSAIVKEYLDKSTSLHSETQMSHLKSWLNSSSSSKIAERSSSIEVKSVTEKTNQDIEVSKACYNGKLQEISTPLQKCQKPVNLLATRKRNSMKRVNTISKKMPIRTSATSNSEFKQLSSFSIFADPYSGSGSDSSTPNSQSLASTSDAKENLFGFEKLLLPNVFRIDEAEVSPIFTSRKAKKPFQSSSNFGTKVSSSKAQLNSTAIQKPSAKAFNRSVKGSDKTNSNNSCESAKLEVTLFDSTLELQRNLKKSIADTSDSNSCCIKKGHLSPKKSKMKSKRKNVVRFKEPEIAWEEIMNHELVIE